MAAVRSFIFNLVLYSSGIVYGILCLTFWLLPKRARFDAVLVWVRFAMWWLQVSCNIKIIIVDHNQERLSDPHVIMSKHQSMWETVFLQYYFLPISTIFKVSLLRLPFFGWGLSLLQPIAIDRSSPVKALRQVKSEGIKRLKDGINLLIFPEGTRVPTGKAGNYARSGAEIAKAAKTKIIPVAHNAGYCWPAKKFTKRAGEIHVVIGKPIETDTLSSREIIAEVQTWIEQQVAEMPKPY